MVLSPDVEFDEEVAWNWETQEENVYDFLPYFEEEEQESMVPTNDTTPFSSPTSQIHEESSSDRPRKMRSLRDIYKETDGVMLDSYDLYCLFMDDEPLTFVESMKHNKWR